jgi:hypothetical protein
MTGIGAHSDQSPSKNPTLSERTHGQAKPRRHANLSGRGNLTISATTNLRNSTTSNTAP